jgi:predicted porin
MKLVKNVLAVSVLAVISMPVLAQTDIDVYGRVHVSTDLVDVGAGQHAAVSSNSSRIGFKGKGKLDNGLSAIWKIESDVDVTGERSELKSRNRYVGVSGGFGSLTVGYRDTPFKKVGGMVGLWADTIGDRRAVLGTGNGSNKFNIRAKNAVTYLSPSLQGVKIAATLSAGEESNSDGSDTGRLASASAAYAPKGSSLLIATAVESRKNFLGNGGSASGVRAVLGYTVADVKLRAIYEDLKADTDTEFERSAYGASVSAPVGKASLKAQVFVADDYKGVADSGAITAALGGSWKLAKNASAYAVYALTDNANQAKFNIAGSGHGDSFKTTAKGEKASGVSVGMKYNF